MPRAGHGPRPDINVHSKGKIRGELVERLPQPHACGRCERCRHAADESHTSRVLSRKEPGSALCDGTMPVTACFSRR